MQVVYFAGAYSDKDEYQVKVNIMKMEMLAMQVCKDTGCVPVVPHCNMAMWGGVQSPQWFYDATLEIMKRCDAVFINLDRSRDSVGTNNEEKVANELGIPVFFTSTDLKAWIDYKDGVKDD